MEQNYIKVRPNVARELGLDQLRVKLPDGNYNLYWPDLRKLGGWGEYPAIIEAVGGKVLTPAEVYAEQQGGVPAPLPLPADPRWLPDDIAPGQEPGNKEDELTKVAEESEAPENE